MERQIKQKQACQTIEHIDVTGMSQHKRRLIFITYMNQNGFSGFIKQVQNNQTYYIFIYELEPYFPFNNYSNPDVLGIRRSSNSLSDLPL